MPDHDPPINAASRFCVLHDADTDLGPLMLRKRWSFALERDVFEMTLNGDLVMSSAVTLSEQALARETLKRLPSENLRLLIGGLGFGFTAQAVLADQRTSELTVVERLAPVIQWHRSGLLPWSESFISDPRLKTVAGDFFATVAQAVDDPAQRYHAIMIDIDDSPAMLWHRNHSTFYESTALQAIQCHLHPGGVLALWCAEHPGEDFVNLVSRLFATTEVQEVHFENPNFQEPETNYILIATTSSAAPAASGSQH